MTGVLFLFDGVSLERTFVCRYAIWPRTHFTVRRCAAGTVGRIVVNSGTEWVLVVHSGGSFLSRDVVRFTGRAEGALDDKGRFVVPARFRERLGAKFIVTIARPDPCLALYPQATWEAFCERLEAAPVKDERYRKFVRHLFAHTDETACDAQGRLLVPAALRTYAGMDRDVVSIGSLTRVELWSKDRLDEMTPSEDEAAAFTTELGLY